MSNTIRITKTKELEKILAEIRAQFPLLDDAEIVKMIISDYYTNLKTHHPKSIVISRAPVEKKRETLNQAKEEVVEETNDYITLYSDSDEAKGIGLSNS